MISQQPHSNLGWRNAPYSYTYAAISRARDILTRRNKTGRPNPGISNSDMWRISETKVSEHNSMSYGDNETIRSLRFPARPQTFLQSILQTAGIGRPTVLFQPSNSVPNCKFIRLAACKKAKAEVIGVSRSYRTVYIPWLVASWKVRLIIQLYNNQLRIDANV